ncbi:MAG: GatB/YqeY domain-containing protein [Candidatus Pacebacteria bacterium]|nr:GatB/YqeY domain-containing protein [Candidatus Paceibacterota bacterium]
MSLQTDIKDQMKDAMKAKDQVRLSVLRGILSSFTNELVAQKKTPQEELADTDALAVIKRLAKQRKDSIEQFQAADRQDLADSEKQELAVLETFLPALMTQDQIRPIAEAKKAELGVTDKTGAGKLVGAVMSALQGQADGTDVKAVVDSLFN